MDWFLFFKFVKKEGCVSMIKELYTEMIREVSLNVSQSKIESVMKKTIKKSGCRVYEDGYIGIAGVLGDATQETWDRAIENLALKIAYPYQPEKDKQRKRDLRQNILTSDEFVGEMEIVLETLRTEFPQFIFSNNVSMSESEITLSNDAGLEYQNIDYVIVISLIVKHVDSVNVFDSAVFTVTRNYSREVFLDDARKQLSAYENLVELPQGKEIPIIATQNEFLHKFYEALNGEGIGLKTSMFSKKMNTKVFADNFNLYIDRGENQYHTPFFDTEGTTVESDKFYLIKEGVILSPYTDKKNATLYQFPFTASAGGNYDEKPSLDPGILEIEKGQKTVKEMLNGELGILVVFASGGDCTNEGDFASPVQMAYLTDGEQLIGKVPEFKLSGNIYNMFGANFLGKSNDRPFFNEHLVVVKMNVDK